MNPKTHAGDGPDASDAVVTLIIREAVYCQRCGGVMAWAEHRALTDQELSDGKMAHYRMCSNPSRTWAAYGVYRPEAT